MNCTIRIKHYVDGYERIVTPYEYNMWLKTEQHMGRPVFQVMGIIINNKYIDIKQIINNIINGGD